MDKKIDASLAPAFADSADSKPTRFLEVDFTRYQHLLDDPNLTDDQKQAFLEALWSIIVAAIDLGFGVHPMQEVSDKSDEFAEIDRSNSPDMLDCRHQFNGKNRSDQRALDAD